MCTGPELGSLYNEPYSRERWPLHCSNMSARSSFRGRPLPLKEDRLRPPLGQEAYQNNQAGASTQKRKGSRLKLVGARQSCTSFQGSVDKLSRYFTLVETDTLSCLGLESCRNGNRNCTETTATTTTKITTATHKHIYALCTRCGCSLSFWLANRLNGLESD